VASDFSCPRELAAADPVPVEISQPDAVRPLLLIADHGGNAVPAAMRGLGLSDADLSRHIAWDPGAAEVAAGLSEKLSATAVIAKYSRLIADPNRPLGDAACMPKVSDGTDIPANHHITADERARRAALFYWPYHTAVDAETARLRQVGHAPMIVAIHSFTPDYQDEDRPWHIGVMSAADRRLAEALLQALRARGDLEVGDNQPYSGVDLGYSIRLHGSTQGLAHAQIEIRQDLLADAKGIARWIKILAEILTPLLDDVALQTIEFY
jgi:predicted N-formylglutamate amidohydrolase